MLRLGLTPLQTEGLSLEGQPEWLCRILQARGISTEDEAKQFLHPTLTQILPGLALHGMDGAVQILTEARQQRKKAVIYGDYDVDGVCAAAILKETFDRYGLSSFVYLPHRHREGYGLNIPAIGRLAKEAQVLVTVDCGITNLEEVKAARAAGMQVIVTDHHKNGETLPDADALVSPLLGDYPFPYLCGAGVAWKLSLALLGKEAMDLIELAAIATVADMVPLLSENRAIVAFGLRKLSQTGRAGLRAVMERAGIKGDVRAEQVAFQIAPRMNACGRLETARIALDMLLTRDKEQAQQLATRMEQLNTRRKEEEAAVTDEAIQQVEKMDLIQTRGIVVMGEKWNSGLIGLAAGKIAEQYTCPTVALARDGELCVGSARSAGEVDIHKALSRCADLFLRFGGHKQAAGLTIEYLHVPAFIERFSDAVKEQTGDRALVPQIICDAEIQLSEVTEGTVAALDKLEPFGMANPMPRFLCRGVKALSLRSVGNQGKHLKCTFQQKNALRDGIFFGAGARANQAGQVMDVVMTPVINRFMGKTSAECQLQAMVPCIVEMPKDHYKEALSVLSQEISAQREAPISLNALDALMQGNQGTLLICHCRETALMLHARYPEADFQIETVHNNKAYHTIVLYGSAVSACENYRHVVLCDGSLGGEAAYQKAYPKAEICALPQSSVLKALLAEMFLGMDDLRACYRAIREQKGRDIEEWASILRHTREQTAFAFKVFSMMGLLQCSFRPFSLALLPIVKASPESNLLFCEARRAKEEYDGIHSL